MEIKNTFSFDVSHAKYFYIESYSWPIAGLQCVDQITRIESLRVWLKLHNCYMRTHSKFLVDLQS